MDRQKISVKIAAKVNLSLNVLGLYEKMHSLDSVVASTDIADVITVAKRRDDDINIKFSCGNVFGADNSVTRAVNVMRGAFGEVGGLDIFVEKNIPVASGLGGSSADAAGVIRAIDYLYGLGRYNYNEYRTALKVGSDVPFMLYGGFARLFDLGAKVMSFESTTELNFVVAKGQSGVLTASAYKEFDALHPDGMSVCSDNAMLVEALKCGDVETVIALTDNALTEASCKLNPEILTTLSALDALGAKRSIMSGSGSACIGFFDDYDGVFRAAGKMRAQGFTAAPHVTLKEGIRFF